MIYTGLPRKILVDQGSSFGETFIHIAAISIMQEYCVLDSKRILGSGSGKDIVNRFEIHTIKFESLTLQCKKPLKNSVGGVKRYFRT